MEPRETIQIGTVFWKRLQPKLTLGFKLTSLRCPELETSHALERQCRSVVCGDTQSPFQNGVNRWRNAERMW